MDQPPPSLLRQFLQAYLAARTAAHATDATDAEAPADPPSQPGQAAEGQVRKPRVVAVFDDEDGQG